MERDIMSVERDNDNRPVRGLNVDRRGSSSIKNLVIFLILTMLISVPFVSMMGSNTDNNAEPYNSDVVPHQKAVDGPANSGNYPAEAGATRGSGDLENLVFFLHKINETEVSKTLPGGGSTMNWFDTEADFNQTRINLTATGTSNIFDWYLSPFLAENLTTDRVTLNIWIQAGGGTAANVGVSLEIIERDSTGAETSIKKTNFGNQQFEKTETLKTWTVTFDSAYKFVKGSSIKVRLDSNPGAGKYAFFYYDSPGFNSRVVIPSTDHMEIQSVSTLDYQLNPTLNYQPTDTNKTMYIRTTVADPLGGYDIEFVNITMTDPSEAIILDNISMQKISGTPVGYLNEYNYIWNYSGYAPGRYNLTILVVDNNGFNNYHHFGLYTFDIFPDVEKSFFYIGALPKYVWVKAVDDQGKPLENTMVYATFGGNPVNFNTTNATGMSNITLYPGQYDFVVKWQGVDVSAYTYNLTDNVTLLDPLLIICAVYYPTFQAIDSAYIIVANAAIYITHPNQTQLLPLRTDSDGNVILDRMAGGNYNIVVRYRGVEVNTSTVFLDTSGTITIRCTIYYITFKAVDISYYSLENIGITVFDNFTAWVLDFRITNTTGIAITRVPMGIVDIQAYWQNIPVNTTYAVDITGDGFIQVVCNIFDVNIKVVDSRSIAVEDAQVNVRKTEGGDLLDSGITSILGETRLHLISGRYYFEVYWRSVLVSAEYIQIIDSTQRVINAAIYYINFKTVDSKSNVVADAQFSIYSSTTGTLLGSDLTDETGFQEVRLPKGNIDLEVYWKTILVNSTTNISISSNVDPFTVNLWVYYLTLSVLDSKDMPITNAQVTTFINGSGEILASGATDKAGLLALRMPKTSIDISIIWDNVVIYTEFDYALTDNGFKQITAWVYYVTFNAVDSKKVAVAGSQITVLDPVDGEILYSQVTDNIGLSVFRLPLGTYDLKVYWHSTLVGSVSDFVIDADKGIYTLNLWIYYVNFKILDSHDMSVTNAQVLVTLPGTEELLDSQMTGAGGLVELRLPVGLVNISVFWKDVEVASQQVTISEDVPATSPVELLCRIYYMTLTAVDSKKVQISNAQIVITNSDDAIMDSLTTGASGSVISRLPVGQYTITARWLDVEVYSEDNVNLASDLSKTLNCNVYYVTFNTKDAENEPLEYSRVILMNIETEKVVFTNVTDELGTIEARVPIGAYTLDVYWQDILVSTTSYYFNKDDSLTVLCDVFYLTVVLEDSKQLRLNNAQIVLSLSTNDKIMASKTTGSNGQREFRLPGQKYDIDVYWQGVLVRTNSAYSVFSTHILTLRCDVFYFTVAAQDSERFPLDKARVELNFNTSGKLYDSIITSSAGEIESRIPIGYYNISIYWKEVLVYSQFGYHINITERLTLTCNVFYLRVKAVDKNNEAISDVTVTITATGTDLTESAYTDKKGMAQFRLPIEDYEVSGRLQTSVYLKKIDTNVSTSINLRQGSENVQLKFSDYPPSFISTPAFYGVTLPILVLIIIIFLIWFFIIRKHMKVKKVEEPEKTEDKPSGLAGPAPLGKIKVKQPMPPPGEPRKPEMDDKVEKGKEEEPGEMMDEPKNGPPQNNLPKGPSDDISTKEIDDNWD